MIEIRETETFASWFEGLRDDRVRAKIAARIERVAYGNFGDVKSVGDGVSELRINYGRDIGSILLDEVRRSSCCFAAETSPPRIAISRRPSGWRSNFDGAEDSTI